MKNEYTVDIKLMEQYKTECCSSKENAISALIKAGIFTSNGKVAEPYQNLLNKKTWKTN